MHNDPVRAEGAPGRLYAKVEENMAAPAIELAICSAREDEDDEKRLLQQLLMQLSTLQRAGFVHIWNEQKILAGTPYAREIEERLDEAGIILLIASAGFIASDYCYEKLLPHALARHNDDSARVLTVLLHPCSWRDTDLKQFPVLPTNHEAISDSDHWPNPHKAMLNVNEGVRRVAIELQVSALAKLGQECIWTSKFDEALSIYKEALALSERYKDEVVIPPSVLARLYQGKGSALMSPRLIAVLPEDKQKALQAFEQAAQLDPTLAYSHEQKGTLLYQLERYEEALPALDAAIRLGEETRKKGIPVPVSPFTTKYNVLLRLGRADEAQAFYLQELKGSFPTLPVHKQAAELFEQAGKYERALEALELAYTSPTNFSIVQDETYYKTKARLLEHLVRYEEALAVLSDYEQLLVRGQRSDVPSWVKEDRPEPKEALAFCSLHKGLLLELLGRDCEALGAFDQVVETLPDSYEAQFGRQRVYERLARQAEKQTKGYIGRFRAARTWKSHHKGPVCCLACSPDGRFFASGGEDEVGDGIVTLWDLSSGQEICTLHGHTKRIECLAFSPNGILYSGSSDATVAAWSRWLSESRWKIAGGWKCPSGVLSLAISPGGHFLASGSADGMVRLYNRSSGKELHAWPGYTQRSSPVRTVAFSPDGFLLSGSEYGTISLFKNIPGEEISSTHDHLPVLSSVFGGLEGMPFIGRRDGAIVFYDFSLQEYPDVGGWHEGAVTGLVCPSDRRFLVSGSLDGTLQLWRVASFAPMQTLEHGSPIHSLALSPDGYTLVSGGEDGTLKLWRLQ